MLFALGAVSSAIEAFQSLTSSSKPSPAKTGFSQPSTASFDVTSTATVSSGTASGSAGYVPGNGISPATMSALLAAQGQSPGTSASTMSPSAALQDLFSQIDGNGDGAIGKSEFENALGAGGTNLAQADDVFGKMDVNGDGSVSLDEMSSALKGMGGHKHHHAHGAGGSQSGTDALLQALDAASSTSTTNSDGSISTTITMADGTKVTQISLPASAIINLSSVYNPVGQAMQHGSAAVSAPAAQSLSVSV
jgi:Ca2+-binding EF-hand superfamily protein